jgi:hypothetical protein
MIETSKNEILKGEIVSEFLSNNKFAAEWYFNNFYEEINTAWLNKNDIILYISPEYKNMMFLNSESEKIQGFIGTYLKIGRISLNSYTRNKYFRDSIIDNTKRGRLNLDKGNILKFIKSKSFKDKVLNIYTKYSTDKIVKKEKRLISDLYNMKITINEATLKQKIFTEFKLDKPISKELILELHKNKINLNQYKDSILVDMLDIMASQKEEISFMKWYIHNLINPNTNEFEVIFKYLLSNLKIIKTTRRVGTNSFGKYQKFNYNSPYFECLHSLQRSFMFKYRQNKNEFEKVLNEIEFTFEEKRDFLSSFSISDLTLLCGTPDIVISIIKKMNEDFIFDINCFESKYVELSGIEKFYAEKFFTEIHIIENSEAYTQESTMSFTYVPKYVKELYVYESEYIKLQQFCSIFKKDLTEIIPDTTKVIFITDVNKDELIKKIV